MQRALDYTRDGVGRHHRLGSCLHPTIRIARFSRHIQGLLPGRNRLEAGIASTCFWPHRRGGVPTFFNRVSRTQPVSHIPRRRAHNSCLVFGVNEGTLLFETIRQPPERPYGLTGNSILSETIITVGGTYLLSRQRSQTYAPSLAYHLGFGRPHASA